jgi:hypothetical protein
MDEVLLPDKIVISFHMMVYSIDDSFNKESIDGNAGLWMIRQAHKMSLLGFEALYVDCTISRKMCLIGVFGNLIGLGHGRIGRHDVRPFGLVKPNFYSQLRRWILFEVLLMSMCRMD